jgi:acetoacetyl-CoA synthetase
MKGEGASTGTRSSPDVFVRAGIEVRASDMYSAVERDTSVHDCLAVLLPDTDGGPGLLVLLVSSNCDEADDVGYTSRVRVRLRHELRPMQVPDVVELVKQIPRSRSGKRMHALVADILIGRPASVPSGYDAPADARSLSCLCAVKARTDLARLWA